MIEEYKGYLISGKALVIHRNSPDWRSQGNVFTKTREGSLLVKRIEGSIFEAKQLAEAHGLALCKKWIDQNLNKEA